MSKVTIEELGKEIYGVEATQMLGGAAKKKAAPKKKTSKKSPSKYASKRIAAQVKAAKKKSTKKKGGAEYDYELVGYPEYCKNEDFKKFMHEFYLYKVLTHTKAAAIYVIPPTKELDEMVSKFNSELKKQGYEPFSEQAIKWSATSNLEFKRCIFDLFADADPMKYRLAKASAPAYNDFGVRIRTNRLKEQLYFKYIDPSTVLISADEDCKTGETAKLIAKSTASATLIFQGKLPKANKIYSQTIKGGDGSEEDLETILKHKKKFLERVGAEKFVYTMAHYNNVVKHFSGDIIHSAFSILYDPKMNVVPNVSLKKQELESSARKLVSKMKLLNSKTNYSEQQKSLKTQYYKSNGKSPLEASSKYISSLKKYYAKAGGDVMLKADIATNMWRNEFENDYSGIYQVVEAIDSPLEKNDLAQTTRFDFEDETDHEFTTSKLNSIIDNYLCSFPFVGLNARNYAPMLNLSGGFDDSDDLETREEITMGQGSNNDEFNQFV